MSDLPTGFPVIIDNHRVYRSLNRIVVEPIVGELDETRMFDTWPQAMDHIDFRNGKLQRGQS